MQNEDSIEEIARSLSFEVEAIPQCDLIQLSGSSNKKPLNVKIKVRKKKTNSKNVQNAVITIPKIGRLGPEKIRLVSSDQTIMSFNVFMEDVDEKRYKQKLKKSFFRFFKAAGSLEHNDDEKINNRTEKKLGILGKCKPGGCLDPPFGEDKYSYVLANRPTTSNENLHLKAIIAENMPVTNKLRLLSENSSDKSVSLKRPDLTTKEQSNDDGIYDNKNEYSEDSVPKKRSRKSSLEFSYSNTLITYPPALTTSKSQITKANDKTTKDKHLDQNDKRPSCRDSSEIYYPQKDYKSQRSKSQSEKVDDDLLSKLLFSPAVIIDTASQKENPNKETNIESCFIESTNIITMDHKSPQKLKQKTSENLPKYEGFEKNTINSVTNVKLPEKPLDKQEKVSINAFKEIEEAKSQTLPNVKKQDKNQELFQTLAIKGSMPDALIASNLPKLESSFPKVVPENISSVKTQQIQEKFYVEKVVNKEDSPKLPKPSVEALSKIQDDNNIAKSISSNLEKPDYFNEITEVIKTAPTSNTLKLYPSQIEKNIKEDVTLKPKIKEPIQIQKQEVNIEKEQSYVQPAEFSSTGQESLKPYKDDANQKPKDNVALNKKNEEPLETQKQAEATKKEQFYLQPKEFSQFNSNKNNDDGSSTPMEDESFKSIVKEPLKIQNLKVVTEKQQSSIKALKIAKTSQEYSQLNNDSYLKPNVDVVFKPNDKELTQIQKQEYITQPSEFSRKSQEYPQSFNDNSYNKPKRNVALNRKLKESLQMQKQEVATEKEQFYIQPTEISTLGLKQHNEYPFSEQNEVETLKSKVKEPLQTKKQEVDADKQQYYNKPLQFSKANQENLDFYNDESYDRPKEDVALNLNVHKPLKIQKQELNTDKQQSYNQPLDFSRVSQSNIVDAYQKPENEVLKKEILKQNEFDDQVFKKRKFSFATNGENIKSIPTDIKNPFAVDKNKNLELGNSRLKQNLPVHNDKKLQQISVNTDQKNKVNTNFQNNFYIKSPLSENLSKSFNKSSKDNIVIKNDISLKPEEDFDKHLIFDKITSSQVNSTGAYRKSSESLKKHDLSEYYEEILPKIDKTRISQKSLISYYDEIEKLRDKKASDKKKTEVEAIDKWSRPLLGDILDSGEILTDDTKSLKSEALPKLNKITTNLNEPFNKTEKFIKPLQFEGLSKSEEALLISNKNQKNTETATVKQDHKLERFPEYVTKIDPIQNNNLSKKNFCDPEDIYNKNYFDEKQYQSLKADISPKKSENYVKDTNSSINASLLRANASLDLYSLPKRDNLDVNDVDMDDKISYSQYLSENFIRDPEKKIDKFVMDPNTFRPLDEEPTKQNPIFSNQKQEQSNLETDIRRNKYYDIKILSPKDSLKTVKVHLDEKSNNTPMNKNLSESLNEKPDKTASGTLMDPNNDRLNDNYFDEEIKSAIKEGDPYKIIGTPQPLDEETGQNNSETVMDTKKDPQNGNPFNEDIKSTIRAGDFYKIIGAGNLKSDEELNHIDKQSSKEKFASSNLISQRSSIDDPKINKKLQHDEFKFNEKTHQLQKEENDYIFGFDTYYQKVTDESTDITYPQSSSDNPQNDKGFLSGSNLLISSTVKQTSTILSENKSYSKNYINSPNNQISMNESKETRDDPHKKPIDNLLNKTNLEHLKLDQQESNKVIHEIGAIFDNDYILTDFDKTSEYNDKNRLRSISEKEHQNYLTEKNQSDEIDENNKGNRTVDRNRSMSYSKDNYQKAIENMRSSNSHDESINSLSKQEKHKNIFLQTLTYDTISKTDVLVDEHLFKKDSYKLNSTDTGKVMLLDNGLRPTNNRSKTNFNDPKQVLSNLTSPTRPLMSKYDKLLQEQHSVQRFDFVNSIPSSNKRQSSSNQRESLPRLSTSSQSDDMSKKRKIAPDNELILIDVTFQSYVDESNRRVLKSLTDNSSANHNKNYKITTIKSLVQPNLTVMKVPIDFETDLLFTILKREKKKNIYEPIKYSNNNKKNECASFGERPLKDLEKQIKMTNKLSEAILPRTLSLVYEKQLIPLQNIIKNLKDEIDSLATQQQHFRQSILGSRKPKFVRFIPYNKKCGCCRKYN